MSFFIILLVIYNLTNKKLNYLFIYTSILLFYTQTHTPIDNLSKTMKEYRAHIVIICVYLTMYTYEKMDTVDHYLKPVPNLSIVLTNALRTTGSCPVTITNPDECWAKARLIYGNMATGILHKDWHYSNNVPGGCSIVTASGIFWIQGHVMSNINTHINPQKNCTLDRTCICG